MQYIVKLEDNAPTGPISLLSNLKETNEDLAASDIDFVYSSDLAEIGYGVFIHNDMPVNQDLTKQYKEVTPSEQDSDGNWLQKFVLEDIVFDTDADKQQAIDSTAAIKMSNLRLQRNNILRDTDWMGASDVTAPAEMLAYRQALRDLPATVNIDAIVYPTDPTTPDYPIIEN